MLPAPGLFQQTRGRRHSASFQAQRSLALRFGLGFFRFRLGFGCRLGPGFGLRLRLRFGLRLRLRFGLRLRLRFGLRLRLRFGFRLGLGFGLRFGLSFGFRLRLGFGCRLGLGLGFRLVLLFQKFADALFQRREVIGDAPSYFLSIRGEFDPADQVRRGLEPDADFSREGFIERVLYRRALLHR